MDEKRYRLAAAAGLILPAEHAETLLALRDGDAALIYIWLLTSGDALREEHCARQLGLSVSAVHAAAEKLRSVGLLGEAAEKKAPLPPPEETPPYTAEDIVRRSREDGAFQALLSETEQLLGHRLSGADLRTLFGIYDRLGLPPEVIMLLIHHCAERTRRRYGEGRLPTMYSIEKEAYRWCSREIMTLELAEAYLAAQEKQETDMGELARTLQIFGRAPTPGERKYMEEWLAMGFPMEALALAYDRTVMGTGKLVWKYMDRILRSWQEKGLRTVREIEEKDGRGTARRAHAAPGPAHSAIDDDLERLEQQMLREKR
ncbi:MAG: DnaD domain protein [Ruminococcaceae bacterium]|nr:DnaD domain protein [Oscillospiraceae bacterium]